jgi:hypothetical protein
MTIGAPRRRAGVMLVLRRSVEALGAPRDSFVQLIVVGDKETLDGRMETRSSRNANLTGGSLLVQVLKELAPRDIARERETTRISAQRRASLMGCMTVWWA